MEVVIAFGGMVAGPDTLEKKSLGGSETAAICAAKALRNLGIMVTVFCNADWEGIDDQGIRWSNIQNYQQFVAVTEVDVIIALRDPGLFSFPNNSKKNILWCHDLATYNQSGNLHNFAWNIDEIWTVSEYHRQQYHKVSGYPLNKIWATRNGISEQHNLLDVPRFSKELLYAARPERGLIHLVRPGGIMSQLPEFNLKVCMYDNYPDQMRGYYDMLFNMAKQLPNVEILGPKTQKQLRQMMKSHAAYVYPTTFEEVSCIIARECIEQGIPFIYTPIGALPETVKDCGHAVNWPRDDIGSDAFCREFAAAIRSTVGDVGYTDALSSRCAERDDLYWDDVVRTWVERFDAKKPSNYSMCLSMVKNGDVIPAYEHAKDKKVQYWIDHIESYYPFITGEKTIEEHYKGIYELEESKGVPERRGMVTLKGSSRYEEIRKAIEPDEIKTVLEYGCAEGPIILQLAMDFPDKQFTGIDIVKTNVELCQKYADEHNITNVTFWEGSTENWPLDPKIMFDAAIIAEVLEHTLEPTVVVNIVEKSVHVGGRMVITVPYGSWEWDGLINNPTQWPWRAHIWHLNKDELRHMFADKTAVSMAFLPYGPGLDGQVVGNTAFVYIADHLNIRPIDVERKIDENKYRQSIAFCIISMNEEENIVRMLKSIVKFADIIQIAMGPSNDRTEELASDFMSSYPWIDFRIIHVPKIEVGKFGFDDARNASIQNIEADWIFWIDSDEYIAGDQLRMYLRNNAFDSYAIHQHHFTVEPRGAPAQLDKPARLFRNGHGFRFFGKVHEHAEIGFNGGPGFTMMMNNIDIGHTGYTNEVTRRQRFSRNFPFLQWDRDQYPHRKIGKFLWLRDLFHQYSWLAQNGRQDKAVQIANEAVDFFEANKDDFLYIGNGPQASLHYYGHALKMIGKGHDVKVRVELDGMAAEYEGVFKTAGDATAIAEKAIQEQFDKRNSGYWT